MAPQIPQGTTYWANYFRGKSADLRSARFLATQRSGTALLTAEGGSTTGVNCFRGEIVGQTASGIATATRATGNVQGEQSYEIGGSSGALTYMGQEWQPAPQDQWDSPTSFLATCQEEG
jgi:hypothetical protein